MFVCKRCRKNITVKLPTDFNTITGRCKQCESEVSNILGKFQQAFRDACKDKNLTEQELIWLSSGLTKVYISEEEAFAFIRDDALYVLERFLTFAQSDGDITEDEAQRLRDLRKRLRIPDSQTKSFEERLDQLLSISNIRRGQLPIVQSTTMLDAKEECHLETEATHNKITRSDFSPMKGRLVVTNRKVHFLSLEGGWSISLKKIMRVEGDSRRVYLEVANGKGNGDYFVENGDLTRTIVDTAVRVAKKQLDKPSESSEGRHIPQDVQRAVWRRDDGKCVKCGSRSYLEFDHIIPFSKGGASSTSNVQLLCRKCNLEKGNSI